MENVWAYLRANKLAISVFDNYEQIVDRCCEAWNFFANDKTAITQSLPDNGPKRSTTRAVGITDPKAVGQLMRDIQQYRERHFLVGAALLLSAYLFPRNTELRGMRWGEIDLKDNIWDIPAQRMKMKRDHVVPLATQAVDILQNLRSFDLGSELVFPSLRDPTRMVSEMTFTAALRRMGYGRGRHVHHGFRTTASTNLNEMGWNSDWIERQLAHVPANKVRSSYNKAEYIVGRKEMMQKYANWLDRRAA